VIRERHKRYLIWSPDGRSLCRRRCGSGHTARCARCPTPSGATRPPGGCGTATRTALYTWSRRCSRRALLPAFPLGFADLTGAYTDMRSDAVFVGPVTMATTVGLSQLGSPAAAQQRAVPITLRLARGCVGASAPGPAGRAGRAGEQSQGEPEVPLEMKQVAACRRQTLATVPTCAQHSHVIMIWWSLHLLPLLRALLMTYSRASNGAYHLSCLR